MKIERRQLTRRELARITSGRPVVVRPRRLTGAGGANANDERSADGLKETDDEGKRSEKKGTKMPKSNEGPESLVGVPQVRKAGEHLDRTFDNLRGVAKYLEKELGVNIPRFAKGGVVKKGRLPKRGRRR